MDKEMTHEVKTLWPVGIPECWGLNDYHIFRNI